jgi:flagellar biosynthesis GTPase FlhF
MLALANRANEQLFCYPSYNRVAKDTGLSSRTVIRLIKELEEKNLIAITRRKGVKGNTSNIFHIYNHNFISLSECHPLNTGKSIAVDDSEPEVVTQDHNATSFFNNTVSQRHELVSQRQEVVTERHLPSDIVSPKYINEQTKEYINEHKDQQRVQKPGSLEIPSYEKVFEYLTNHKSCKPQDIDGFINHWFDKMNRQNWKNKDGKLLKQWIPSVTGMLSSDRIKWGVPEVKRQEVKPRFRPDYMYKPEIEFRQPTDEDFNEMIECIEREQFWGPYS